MNILSIKKEKQVKDLKIMIEKARQERVKEAEVKRLAYEKIIEERARSEANRIKELEDLKLHKVDILKERLEETEVESRITELTTELVLEKKKRKWQSYTQQQYIDGLGKENAMEAGTKFHKMIENNYTEVNPWYVGGADTL